MFFSEAVKIMNKEIKMLLAHHTAAGKIRVING